MPRRARPARLRNYGRRGTYDVECPVCGFEFPNTQFRRRWDGVWACLPNGCWAKRNEKEIIRPPKVQDSRRLPFVYPAHSGTTVQPWTWKDGTKSLGYGIGFWKIGTTFVVAPFNSATDFGAAGLSVSSITTSGTVATYTTASSHSFSAGTTFVVQGNQRHEFNGSFKVQSVTSSVVFTAELGISPIRSSYGTIIVQRDPSERVSFATWLNEKWTPQERSNREAGGLT